jgi:hypothetical protein
VETLDDFAAHCAHGIQRITARQVDARPWRSRRGWPRPWDELADRPGAASITCRSPSGIARDSGVIGPLPAGDGVVAQRKVGWQGCTFSPCAA